MAANKKTPGNQGIPKHSKKPLRGLAHTDAGLRPVEIAVVVAGAVLTVAGFRSDDKLTLLACLIVAWCALAFLCYAHKGSAVLRGMSLSIITVMLIVVGYRTYSRQLNDEQLDAFNHLEIKMVLPSSKDPWHSVVHISNGEHTKLRSHTVSCSLILIVSRGGKGFIEGGGRLMTIAPDTLLAGGGDEDTNPCLLALKMDADCFDVKVIVDYSLETQPDVKKEKRHRFMAVRPDFEWQGKPVEYDKSYCQAFRQ